ncbi:MAG: hypothetical protein ABI426_04420 [Flavobacterium sp.]
MRFSIIYLIFFSSLLGYSQISGCTDVNAKNYNPKAVLNDGSCVYKEEKIK